jgi:hypothetical protein
VVPDSSLQNVREPLNAHRQKRLLKWWWWTSDRLGGRLAIVLFAVLLRLLFPGIWTSWIGVAVIILLLILLLGLSVSVAIRAYRGKG